ncbi:hypothetical protein J4Q44_G00011640 [Coregonus suidteri]|uniref:Ig-like domain-containing protein n=1 Tax=Coregonus suidteri TaxID=861788 RepID=A0AAN8ML24_9TELE
MVNGELIIQKVQQVDSGMYQCVAENKYGAIYSSAELSILGGFHARRSERRNQMDGSLRKMSKIERLNARVAKLLTVAVHEVLQVVKETVSEYQENTARTQRENESLRKIVQELQDKMKSENTGAVQTVTVQLELQNCKQELSLGLSTTADF